jgi:biopolymer transport protein ExbD
MNLKKKTKKEFSIDISSLVDVLFTLLIFFSLTSTFVRESGLKVDLPEASSSNTMLEVEKVELTIGVEGNMSMNDIPVEDIDDLKSRLSKFDTGMRIKYLMVIKADTKTQHGLVTNVLDMLKLMKFENIAIATRSSE